MEPKITRSLRQIGNRSYTSIQRIQIVSVILLSEVWCIKIKENPKGVVPGRLQNVTSRGMFSEEEKRFATKYDASKTFGNESDAKSHVDVEW